MPAIYQIDLYKYVELDQPAKDRAFESWYNGNERAALLEYEYTDIARAIDSFETLYPFARHKLHYDSVFYPSVNAYSVIGEIEPAPEYLTTGDCYGYDIAEEWNKHAANLEELATALQEVAYHCGNVDDHGPMYEALSSAQCTLETALENAVSVALDAVAATINHTYSAIEDYYSDPRDMRELFEDHYAPDHVYNVNGLAVDIEHYGLTETA